MEELQPCPRLSINMIFNLSPPKDERYVMFYGRRDTGRARETAGGKEAPRERARRSRWRRPYIFGRRPYSSGGQLLHTSYGRFILTATVILRPTVLVVLK